MVRIWWCQESRHPPTHLASTLRSIQVVAHDIWSVSIINIPFEGDTAVMLAYPVYSQSATCIKKKQKTKNKQTNKKTGQPGWLSSLAPPLAQGLILETQDGVWLPAWSLLLPLPVSLPLSLCLSSINK